MGKNIPFWGTGKSLDFPNPCENEKERSHGLDFANAKSLGRGDKEKENWSVLMME